MTPIYRPGGWTDVVALPDGRLGQVAVNGATVAVYLEDASAPLWQQAAPEALLFCRCAVHQGLVVTIHQGQQSGRAWLVRQGGTYDLGPTFGVQPVAIDARYAYVVRSNQSYDRIDIHSGEQHSFPHGCPGSSQGISDIAEDGAIWWADLHRTIVEAGVTLTYPNRRGGLLVGQADPPQIVGVLQGVVGTIFDGDGYEPHVAPANGRYAVGARTPKGAAFTVLTRLVDEAHDPVIVNGVWMEPWSVTFTHFDPAIVRGLDFRARVALGNGVEVEFQKDARDDLHAAVFKDGVQQDRSGRQRHVEVSER